ncbi:hypothetical protein [Martelella alba]|uniref:Helix-turn-helix domain-containing protein n=1 Tax=Martelella alba TaxID=2590451 RepID=A0ABY2SFK0_9HYPH|nr:hypothetical protein [Martelella alba]TKI02573.1 hypothetical protein FCN80_24630 [Martelella alba]
MNKIGQKEVINEMLGKNITGKILSEILTSKYPDMDASIKTVRVRIEALLHSDSVNIEVIASRGKPNIYKLKSVSDKFFVGCQRQAMRKKTTPKGRPPFEPHEQCAAVRLLAFDGYLRAARAANHERAI